MKQKPFLNFKNNLGSHKIARDKDQPVVESQQISTTTLKDIAQQQKPNQATIERVRLSYYNPYQHEDFASARMYWGSSGEIWARLIILLAAVLNIVMGLLIGRTMLGSILQELKASSIVSVLNLSYANAGMTLMAFISGFVMILVALPMLVSRRAGAVHGWAVFYLFFTCLAFFAVELFLILGLTLATVVNIFKPFANKTYPYYFIMIDFVLTVLWIVGACLLLVKSDDVTRQVGVE